MYKKIAIRILLLMILLIALNYIYKATFYEKDLQEFSSIINKVRDIPGDAKIIYLGESSNTNYREEDLDRRSISSFIEDYFPDLTTYNINKNASHAGIFKVLLQNIPKDSEVETVIVTLNMRSFNAQWIYSDMETPLQKSLVLIRKYPPLLSRALLSFKAFDNKNVSEREKQFKAKWEKDDFSFPYDFPYQNVIEWDEAMAEQGVCDAQGVRNSALTNLACHYIKAYAFQIDTLNHPRIRDFDQIVDLAKKRGWKLVFNLMGENAELAGELAGEDLLYLMEENRKILVNYYEGKGVYVVDNLYSVPDEEFTDRDWTTEHYGEKGRKIIARNVAEELKEWYAEEYDDGTIYP